MRANSAVFMQNAMIPGRRMTHIVVNILCIPLKNSLVKRVNQPSMKIEHRARLMPIMGASQNRVANGLFIPIDSLSRRIWVNDQRSPERHEAVRTCIIPTRWNCVSEETIIITPPVIIAIIPISGRVGFSSRKMKAKRRTKPSTEDLHMAEGA